MKEKMFCLICEESTNYVADLFSRYHLIPHHGINMKEYYDKCLKKDKEGVCEMCEQPTKFINCYRGYRKYCTIGCLNNAQKYSEKQRNINSVSISKIDFALANSKRKATCLKKYNQPHVSQVKSCNEKKIKTNMSRYGSADTLNLSLCKSNRIKSLTENKEEIQKKRLKKICDSDNIAMALSKRRETCLDRYGVDSVFKLDNTWDVIRSNNYKNKKWINPENLEGYDKYHYEVMKETKLHTKKLRSEFTGKCYYFNTELNKKKHDRFQMTVDHKISIFYGYNNNIPASVIGNYDNLCVCSRIVNCIKNLLTEEEFRKSERYKKIEKNIQDKNFSYKVKTASGFCNFSGVKKKKKQVVYKVTLENGYSVKCTKDHRFVVCGIDMTIADIQIGEQQLETVDGYSTVVSIEETGVEDVYDLISVENETSSYFTNGISSHNCSFTGSTTTLINGDFLGAMKYVPPPHLMGEGYVMWKKPESKRIYAAGVDVGAGTNSDFSLLNVFDITDYTISGKYDQVAMLRRNDLSVFDFGIEILKIAKTWNDALLIIENNGTGLGSVLAKQLYFEDEYENVYYDAEKGEYGVNANRKTKSLALVFFKSDIEDKRMKIVSQHMIEELGYYEEQKDGIFGARSGNNFHDDTVSSGYWVSYALRQPWVHERIEWFLDQIGKGKVLNKNKEEIEDETIADAFTSSLRSANPEFDFHEELWKEDRD